MRKRGKILSSRRRTMRRRKWRIVRKSFYELQRQKFDQNYRGGADAVHADGVCARACGKLFRGGHGGADACALILQAGFVNFDI